MSKKKGLSLEEKRVKLQELLVESKDVFTLKQLESLAPKQKGIISQSVKDVLQSLVDDNIAKSEKLGTSNYFWCFPTDKLHSRKLNLEKLTNEVATLKRKREELGNQITEAKKARPDSDERRAKLAKLDELEKENASLKSKIRNLADNNPELIQAMKKDAERAKIAANRWTDNIFTLKSYCTANFGMDTNDFNRNFDIPENFDYI